MNIPCQGGERGFSELAESKGRKIRVEKESAIHSFIEYIVDDMPSQVRVDGWLESNGFHSIGWILKYRHILGECHSWMDGVDRWMKWIDGMEWTLDIRYWITIH